VNILQKRGIKNVFQAVLDETPGSVEFLITNNNGQSSSILELNTVLDVHPEIRVIQKLILNTDTLENFVRKHTLPDGCLEFIVMDIQGAELRVLRGSPNTLKHCKMLLTEISSEELYKGLGLFKDLNLFLEEQGFICVKHYFNDKNYGDALYIRREFVV
jgi:FkbM family methyltransferase